MSRRFNILRSGGSNLFGESEGKDEKGIYPSSANYSTDLHSLGQYVQEGRRDLFETVLNVEKPKHELTIEEADSDLDGLNYLAGKTVDFVNKKAFQGTMLAHTDGNVPNLIVNIPELNAYTFGYLVYFFEKACAMSGYLLGVNPFDQPGVEAYKVNMFALLGKPGFEEKKLSLKNVSKINVRKLTGISRSAFYQIRKVLMFMKQIVKHLIIAGLSAQFSLFSYPLMP